MAKKKITRKELLKEEEFVTVSNRVFEYLSDHVKQVQYLSVAVLVIIATIIGTSLYFRYINKKALAEYNSAYKYFIASDGPVGEEGGNVDKAIDGFERLIEEYGWTKVATQSIPQLAYLKFGQGKYDEAVSLYSAYLKKNKSDLKYHSLARFGLAAAYEAKKDYQAAIMNLEVLTNDESNFLREEATFALGRVFALNGQEKKSEETYREFIVQFNESPLLPQVKAFL